MSADRYLKSTPSCPSCPHGLLSARARNGQCWECHACCRRRFAPAEVYRRVSSDAASQSKPNEIDEVDDVTLMWRRLTDGYKFEDGFSYDTLTEQFAIDDENVAQAVCSEAFSDVMDDSRTLDVRTQSEFQTLHEITTLDTSTPSEGTAEAHAEDEAPTALLRDSHPQSPASAVYHIDDGEGHPLCNCASDAQYTPVPLAEAKASTARQCGNCTIARQGEQKTKPC